MLVGVPLGIPAPIDEAARWANVTAGGRSASLRCGRHQRGVEHEATPTTPWSAERPRPMSARVERDVEAGSSKRVRLQERSWTRLRAVVTRGTDQRDPRLQGNGYAPVPLVVELTEGHDPRHSPVRSDEPDVGSHLHSPATSAGGALDGPRETAPSLPMAEPRLLSDRAPTFSAGGPRQVLHSARHMDLPLRG